MSVTHSESGSTSPKRTHEDLFDSSKLELVIPLWSDIPGADDGGPTELKSVETGLDELDHARPSRDVAFLDEKLVYFVTLSIAANDFPSPSGSTAPPPEIIRFVSCLQMTLNSSFIPPLPPKPTESTAITPHPASSGSRTNTQSFQSQQDKPPLASSSSSSSLAPNDRLASAGAQSSSSQPITPSTAGFNPYTPNPFPSMNPREGQYAGSEGVTVWEGPVGVDGKMERRIHRNGEGWRVTWKGEVPVAFVRTQIHDPMLSLTATMTLRNAPDKDSESGTNSVDGDGSDHHVEDHRAVDDDEETEDALAGMEEIDLLGGLTTGGGLPASRLANSIQQDLSINTGDADGSGHLTAVTAITLSAALSNTATPSIVTPSTSGPSRQRVRGLSISVTKGAATRPVTPSTLRKSYRRVLGLSSGLRVRMRTLFLPQLLSPSAASISTSGTNTPDYDGEGAGERRVALCVEVENPFEASSISSSAPARARTSGTSLAHPFEITNVVVEIGGQGGEASAHLLCQPEQLRYSHSPGSHADGRRRSTEGKGVTGIGPVFPFDLCPVEQYNLLYAVNVATSTTGGSNDGTQGSSGPAPGNPIMRGDEQRPVAIIVTGRPYHTSLVDSGDAKGEKRTSYPTAPFQSRWNCTLDLAPFYASLSATTVPPPSVPDHPGTGSGLAARNRTSKTVQPPVNAFTGDKRYSLAKLMSKHHTSQHPAGPGAGPHASAPMRNRAVSASRPASRVPSYASLGHQREHQGLLMSVKVLPPEGTGRVTRLDPFSVEVFVHNRTEEIKRFRLIVPGREGMQGPGSGTGPNQGRLREIWEKRRRKGPDEPQWRIDDPILRQILIDHLSSGPALIPLENDVRCGPLYPGASMSARIRFLPLREGVHKLEKLRVTGVNDDMDFIMSPVLDVIVGH